jgi:Transposase DDE domain
MKTITQVSYAMRTILGPVADQLGWETGFTRRQGKLSGSAFVQAMVFSVMGNADLTYTNLRVGAKNAGVEISNQGLEQRFTVASAALCQRVLEEAVRQVIMTEPTALPLLQRFAGVYIRDSSTISLPNVLEGVWSGGANQHCSRAGLKLQVRLEVCSGQLAGPVLRPAREHDGKSPYQNEPLPPGAVRMADLGFYALDQFVRDQSRQIYWFSRYKARTLLYDEHDQAIDLLGWLHQQNLNQCERTIYLGEKEHLACRLLAERVPSAVIEQRKRKLNDYARKNQTPVTAELLALAEWTLIITNIPSSLLSIPEALVLLHVRWQIELLFRLWKSLFKVDEWRSHKPWRILTELYAKLINVVILHWTFLIQLWKFPDRSLWKAALIVRCFATDLALALPDLIALERVLSQIQDHFGSICHISPRRAHPITYQRLENPLICTTLA